MAEKNKPKTQAKQTGKPGSTVDGLNMPHFGVILDQLREAEFLIQDLSVETLEALAETVKRYGVSLRELVLEAVEGQDRITIDRALEFERKLPDALVDAGFDDVAAGFNGGFRTVEQKAFDYFRVFDSGMAKPGFDVTDIRVFSTIQTARFGDLADNRLVQPFRDAMFNAVWGGRSSTDVIKDLRAVMDERGIVTRDNIAFTDRQLETLVESSYRNYYATTKNQQALELDMQVFWYQGPDDKLTRSACRQLLRNGKHGRGDMWLRSEIHVGMVSDLQQDPFVFRGGFNCRHTWNPVTIAFAESMGFKTPKGVPSDAVVKENAEDM